MKNVVRSFGFTLIELLVVLVILGLSVSVVAPDMFKMLERVQKREEQMTISETLKLIKERSFFSASDYFITFKDNQFSAYEYLAGQGIYTAQELALICNREEGQALKEEENEWRYTEDVDDYDENYEEGVEEKTHCNKLKQVFSQFYTFEELSFLISGGEVNEHQFIKFFENDASPSFTLAFD